MNGSTHDGMGHDGTMERMYLPPHAPPSNHGRTTAAWTGVVIILIGGLAAAVGIATGATWLFIVGLAVALLGVVVGKIMQVMGYGQPAPRPRSAPAVRRTDERSAHAG